MQARRRARALHEFPDPWRGQTVSGPVWAPVKSTRGSNAPESPKACAGRGARAQARRPDERDRDGQEKRRAHGSLIAEGGAKREGPLALRPLRWRPLRWVPGA